MVLILYAPSILSCVLSVSYLHVCSTSLLGGASGSVSKPFTAALKWFSHPSLTSLLSVGSFMLYRVQLKMEAIQPSSVQGLGGLGRSLHPCMHLGPGSGVGWGE